MTVTTSDSETTETTEASPLRRILLGRKLTPELVAILLVYFVQGILGLSRLAVSFLLKDDLGLSPAEVSALTGIVMVPWMVKPLFGFLSDGFPILGYRRRPYLIFAGILGSLTWLAMATIVHSAWLAGTMATLSSLSVVISDVIIDSLVVSRARHESQGEAGSLQSLCWGVSAAGGILTAYLSGFLLEYFSVRVVFAITATFPLLVAGTAWLIDEQPVTELLSVQTVKLQIAQVYRALTRKVIFWPTAFLLLWMATPRAESAFFYFITNDLGFHPEFLGRVRLATSVAALIGVFIFQTFLRNISFRKLFFWGTLASGILGMTALLLVTHANRTLGIDDQWFALGDDVILTVAGELTFMPFLVMAARLCPPGVEAAFFALLMSVAHLGSFFSRELGAVLTHLLGVTETNFTNLWLLVLITNLSTLLPLPLVRWLPDGDIPAEARSSLEPLSDSQPESLRIPIVDTWMQRWFSHRPVESES